MFQYSAIFCSSQTPIFTLCLLPPTPCAVCIVMGVGGDSVVKVGGAVGTGGTGEEGESRGGR